MSSHANGTTKLLQKHPQPAHDDLPGICHMYNVMLAGNTAVEAELQRCCHFRLSTDDQAVTAAQYNINNSTNLYQAFTQHVGSKPQEIKHDEVTVLA